MKSDKHVKHVPPGATCHIVDHSSQFSDIAAFVPNEGLVILQDGRVTGWCDIGDENVTVIAIYWTYQPLNKHYVLQCASKVIVISNSVPLRVTHTFKDVIKFEIHDFKNVGFPQLGLWEISADAPRVTDLTASSSQPSSNPVETILRTKLRGLKLSVDKVRRQLEDKKLLRRHCMFRMLGSSLAKNIQSLQAPPSTLSIPATILMETEPSRPVLLVLKSWHRLLHRCWILGCTVKNSSLLPVRSVSLSVSPGAPCEGPRPLVKWRVMVRSPGASDAADAAWTPLLPEGVLEAGQYAVIVASVPEPAFVGRSHVAEMRGMLSAVLPDGKETWAGVPGWRLSVDAVLRGELVPFFAAAKPMATQEQQELREDLLASMACCPVRVALRLEGRDGLPVRVARLLASAGLRAPGQHGQHGHADDGSPPPTPQGVATLLVGSGSPETPLYGAVAVLRVQASTSCTLRLHVRDGRLVFLLLHSLRAGLPQHTRLLAAEADALAEARAGDADLPTLGRALLRALEAELGALANPLGRNPSRPQLHPLELATDLAAQRLRVAKAAAAAATV